MIDSAPAPGWWLASDGNWYPPELHPDLRARLVPQPTRINRATTGLVLDDVPLSSMATAAAPATPRPTEAPATFDAPLSSVASAPAPATFDAPVSREPPPRPDVAAPRRRADGSRSNKLTLAALASVATLGFVLFQSHRDDNDRGHLADPPSSPAVPPTTLTPGSSSPLTTLTPGSAATAPGATPAPSSASTTPAGTGPNGSRAPAPPSTAAPTTAAGARSASVLDLARGQCLDQPDLSTGLLTTVRVVACNQPHTHEVYLDVKYTESETFDADKISNFANARCTAEFRNYVGIDFEVSRYQYLVIVPTLDTWTKDRDRNIVCVAYDEDAKLSASIAGTKR